MDMDFFYGTDKKNMTYFYETEGVQLIRFFGDFAGTKSTTRVYLVLLRSVHCFKTIIWYVLSAKVALHVHYLHILSILKF